MGEIKSVKVDNWGVFFLQKLQNFFNKTDYCDLTLQFRDNSQLKVHRLVLSACTDYFNVLEQTCEVVDDAIIMPNGLQADVVVPIVNFMYTGTLEFELKMYNRLLRTAKDMNMTVLLKLLEAHRRTMEMHPQKTQTPTSPKPRRKAGSQTAANLPANAGARSLIQPNQNKRLIVGSNVNMTVPQQQQRIPPGNTLSRLTSAGPIPVKQQIGSTTFTRIKQENEQDPNTPPQGGYTLLKQSPQQQQQFQQIHHQQQATPTSPFEQLRKGYNNNKRPAVSTFISPPAKKPNLEDVKEFAEQQRMRKQIAAEYGDDDYDANNIMDDDNIHNDDDDDDTAGAGGQAQQMAATSASAGSQTSNQQQTEDPPGTTTIIVKHEGPDKPPTIVVKDNSNSKMNHAKIISEVLRQYPHLVKSNKNIKLKIMPNSGGQTQKIIVKKEQGEVEKSPVTTPIPAISKLPTNILPIKVESQPLKPLVTNIVTNKPKALQQQPPILPQTKANTTITQSSGNKPQPMVASAASTTTASVQAQKRRIDSKTMHALIALGAENTTGPWLCLRCGRNGHPISIPSYRGFRRHLINTHKEIIDPALCEHCGWRSASKRELHYHMQIEHKVRTNLYIFPECQLCNQMCIDSDGLNQHLIDSHPDENKQQCIYCNKIFPEELQLYTHMKTFHKKQALEDGIIDYSDDENNHDTLAMPPPEYDQEMPEEQQQQQQHEELDEEREKKVKILSDISLPIASSIIKTDSFSMDNVNIQESTSAVVSEEYLQEQDHTETKFVAADGSEVILTDEQRKEILSQLNQEHEGSGVVMVLNEQQQYVGGDQQSEQGAISHDETSQATTATNEEQLENEEEHHDESQIYSELKSETSHIEEDSTSQIATALEAEATNDEQEQEEQEHEDVSEEHEAEQENEQQQPENLDESKESIDNLEWAENLISAHDLADEVSQTTADTTESNKPEEKDEIIKEEDNKSQDEISKKLKELTGDWSEDDDEDIPEEEPMQEDQFEKEVKKDEEKKMLKEKLTTDDTEMYKPKEEEENKIEKNHQIEQEENNELKADERKESPTLEAKDKEELEEIKEIKEKPELPEPENDNTDEDDIDLALKSLHKEDPETEEEGIETKEKEQIAEKEEKEVEKNSDVAEKTEKSNNEVKEKTENIGNEDEKSEEMKTENEEEEVKKPEKNKIIAKAESSSVMEVDEETKKDLIESLLKEQPENIEDSSDTETPTKTAKSDLNIEEDSKTKEENKSETTSQANLPELTESEPTIKDEFLDITPENKDAAKEAKISLVIPSTSTTTAEVVNTSSTTSAKDTISSEDRVKSLISEWGDDDEDDDDDTDLTANL